MADKYSVENSAYLQAYNDYAAKAQANYDAQVAYMNERAASDRNSAAQSYDSNARTAYLNYLKQQNALNETLRNNGINGGASETGYINVANNYARNQATNDASRSASITSINNNYNDAKNELYSALQSDLNANYLNAYSAAIQEMQNLQAQDKADFVATHAAESYKNKDAVQKAIDKLDPTDPNYSYYLAYLQNIKRQVPSASKKTSSSSKSSGTSKPSSGGSPAKKATTGSKTVNGTKVPTKTTANPVSRKKTAAKKETNPHIKYSPAWYGWESSHK